MKPGPGLLYRDAASRAAECVVPAPVLVRLEPPTHPNG